MGNPRHHNLHQRHNTIASPTNLYAKSSASSSSSKASASSSSSSYDELSIGEDPYAVATLLLNLVVQRRKEEIDNSFDGFIKRFTPSYSNHRQRQAIQIQTIVEQLQQYGQVSSPSTGWEFPNLFGPTTKPHTYDITESLLASGFFCTLYWYTPNMPNAPKPLWEQLSLKDSNIKGQQYYERNDFQEAVINYSEIWGQALYITAEGTFKPIISGVVDDDDDEEEEEDEDNGNGNGWFQTTMLTTSSSAPVKNNRRLRTCPDVFQVNATKVTLHALGLSFQLPIQGSSNLVIVYADPRIRIFVSPMESKSRVGNWEEAGLVVVQVRSDLVLGEPKIDLR
jgi:hypothetical protein